MSKAKSQRREDLLEAAIEYLLNNGIANLSLRPLAAGVGSKARLLIYHFGSKDALVADAMIVVRERVQNAFAEVVHNGVGLLPSQIITTFWKWATAVEHQQYLKLFFEVHGLALQGPAQYGPYLEGAVASWIEMMASALPDRLPQKKRHALATLAVGAVAGLLLDYLSSRNQPRTSEALAIFAKSFDPMVLNES
jgi:AcrR family transcriptional regulator